MATEDDPRDILDEVQQSWFTWKFLPKGKHTPDTKAAVSTILKLFGANQTGEWYKYVSIMVSPWPM